MSRVRTTVAGLVMAAGRSERMGRPKQLLAYGDSTLLGTVVAAAEASRLDPVVVVLGHRAEEVEASLQPNRAHVVRNPDYERGNLTSLRVGIAAAGPGPLAVLPGDEPGLSPSVIDSAIEALERTGAWAVVVEYRGTIGHPFVLSGPAVERVDALTGVKPLWRWIVEAPEGEVVHLEVNDPPPIDVNTPEDYAAALRAIE